MGDIFVRILLGHLVGDYILQGRKMALAKSKKGHKGLLWCLLHCSIYTAVMCLFLWTYNPLIIVLVFLSHFPIDRWSLANKWLQFKDAHTFIDAYQSTEKYRELDIAFSALVYTVVDNTFHLLLLWGIANFFL